MITRPTAPATPRTRELLIVTREAPRLHDYLVREFAGAPEVQVIFDRRVRERRRRQRTPEADRRRGDRRGRMESDEHLDALGWAVVRLP
ncbi:MAG: hypothetical protein ACREJG_03180 [Candidatus Rokuibacteriota bacterium]